MSLGTGMSGFFSWTCCPCDLTTDNRYKMDGKTKSSLVEVGNQLCKIKRLLLIKLIKFGIYLATKIFKYCIFLMNLLEIFININ